MIFFSFFFIFYLFFLHFCLGFLGFWVSEEHPQEFYEKECSKIRWSSLCKKKKLLLESFQAPKSFSDDWHPSDFATQEGQKTTSTKVNSSTIVHFFWQYWKHHNSLVQISKTLLTLSPPTHLQTGWWKQMATLLLWFHIFFWRDPKNVQNRCEIKLFFFFFSLIRKKKMKKNKIKSKNSYPFLVIIILSFFEFGYENKLKIKNK